MSEAHYTQEQLQALNGDWAPAARTSADAVLVEYESCADAEPLAVGVVRCDVPATVLNVSMTFRPTGRMYYEPIEDEL